MTESQGYLEDQMHRSNPQPAKPMSGDRPGDPLKNDTGNIVVVCGSCSAHAHAIAERLADITKIETAKEQNPAAVPEQDGEFEMIVARSRSYAYEAWAKWHNRTLERLTAAHNRDMSDARKRIAELEAQVPTWIPVNDRMPEHTGEVLATYINWAGKRRRVRAYYAPMYTIEQEPDDYESTEYHPETEISYLREGWYESNEHEEINWRIDEAVTHWTPLLAAPKEDA